jgi:hypothetical protein
MGDTWTADVKSEYVCRLAQIIGLPLPSKQTPHGINFRIQQRM